jgi:hypothetical protein
MSVFAAAIDPWLVTVRRRGAGTPVCRVGTPADALPFSAPRDVPDRDRLSLLGTHGGAFTGGRFHYSLSAAPAPSIQLAHRITRSHTDERRERPATFPRRSADRSPYPQLVTVPIALRAGWIAGGSQARSVSPRSRGTAPYIKAL